MEVRIKNLTKKYKKKVALDNISCSLKSQKYGLIGPNGSGKTTFMRCLLDIVSYKGTIEFEGQNQHIQIGYLPQIFNAFKELTVFEQLEYFLVLKKLNIDKEEEIQRVLKIVNLDNYKYEKTMNLSGGMVRRLGIAQALLGKPDILIFDEPTVGLDPDERLRFREIIRNIELDIPIILSTHIIEDVSSICDSLIFFKEGKLKWIGNMSELFKQFQNHVYECPIEQIENIEEKFIKTEISNNKVRIISYSLLTYKFLHPVEMTIRDIYQIINNDYETIFKN